ncbi:MAG: Membrane protein involved in the export of O-antigen, teichoic acid lipoteichoic acid [Deltaproteobacteria bacterium]|nr:Membrane protein involved in the export of O-antigen, teichoic acid lipoteichoic acid [Deltaproteobacteria bacterium]
MKPAENAAWQALDQGLGRGLLLLFYMSIPMVIGLEAYGRFAFVQAAMLIVAQPVMLLGLDLIVVKRVARGEHGAVRDAVLARAGLVGATGVVVIAAAAVAAPGDLTLVALLWLYLGTLAFEGLVFAYFRGIEWMRAEGIVGTTQKALALPLLGLLAMAQLRGAVLPAATLALAASAGAVLLVLLYGGRVAPAFRRRERRGENAGAAAMLREGSVIGLAALTSVIYFRVDSVMLGLLRGSEAVGIYNVAYRLMEGTLIVPIVFMNVVFPRLAKAADLRAAVGRAGGLLAAVGLVVSAAFAFGGPPLITLVYGGAYERAGSVSTVLALAIAPIYVGTLLTQALIASDRQLEYLRLAVLALAANVGLDAVLIPPYGEVGAAAATVATEVAVAIAGARLLSRQREGTAI